MENHRGVRITVSNQLIWPPGQIRQIQAGMGTSCVRVLGGQGTEGTPSIESQSGQRLYETQSLSLWKGRS